MSSITEAVAQRENKPAAPTARDLLRTLVERNRDAVGASLPSGYSAERFVRLLLTAANTNPDLFDTDPRSFLAAGVTAAQLGLEPNDPRGLAYLIPFRDKRRGRVTQLIVGYRGMLELARRSGYVTAIQAHPVFRGDIFNYRLGLDPRLEHIPGDDDDPKLLSHVYAIAKVRGDAQFVVLTRAQIDRVMTQYARAKESPWHTHYVEMALKTALRRLCKWLPQTVEMALAESVDERTDLALTDIALPAGHSVDVDMDDIIEIAGTDRPPESAPAAGEADADTEVSAEASPEQSTLEGTGDDA